MLPARSAPYEQTRIVAEVVLYPVAAKQTGKPEGQAHNTENEEIALTRDDSGTESQRIPDEILFIEPQKAPEPVKAIEPQKVPEVIRAVEPQKAPVPVKAVEPKKNPEPAKAAKSQRAPVREQPTPKAEPPKNTTSNTTENIAQGRQAENNNTSKGGNISSSVQEETTIMPGTAARSHSLPKSAPSIAGVESVIVVNRVTPVYPQISRRRGEEGNVVLLAVVENGKVVNVSIEKSSGIKALDSSALSAVGKWSFSSDTNVTVRIPVSFKLKN